MFLYPFLRLPFGLDVHAYGIYAGSTIHEVAQVVVAAVSYTHLDVYKRQATPRKASVR